MEDKKEERSFCGICGTELKWITAICYGRQRPMWSQCPYINEKTHQRIHFLEEKLDGWSEHFFFLGGMFLVLAYFFIIWLRIKKLLWKAIGKDYLEKSLKDNPA